MFQPYGSGTKYLAKSVCIVSGVVSSEVMVVWWWWGVGVGTCVGVVSAVLHPLSIKCDLLI